MTARTPMPFTVPATWCWGFGPHASSGSNGTGTMTRFRRSRVTLASKSTGIMLARAG